MKDAKFNPIPENPAMSVGYNPEAVANMSREDFGKSGLASLLVQGEEINPATRNKWLDAWHTEATRLYKAANPEPPKADTVKTK